MKREWLAISGAHAALTALTFLRLWPRLQTHVVTVSGFDLGPNLWILWWGPFALERGMNPFWTSWMFHPLRSPMLVDANLVLWLLAWPLKALLNPVGVYNILAAFSYFATGVASYALFRLFSRSLAGSLLASLVFTFSSYRNYCFLASYPDMLQTQWCVVLIVASALYARDSWPWNKPTWVLTATALAAYSDPRSFLMTLMFLAIYAAVAMAQRRAQDAAAARRLAWKALLCAAAAVLLAAPVVVWAAQFLGPLWYGVGRHSETQLVGLRQLLLPPQHHALRGLLPAPATTRFFEYNSGYVNPAVLLLALLGWSRASRTPEARSLAVVLGVFALLEAVRWPLAYIPVLSYLHVPARFALVTSLIIGLFAAFGWEAASVWLRGQLPRRLAWILLCTAVVLETNPVFYQPIQVWSKDEPALEALRNLPGDGAVLDLPLGFSAHLGGSRENFRAYVRATRHEKPLLNGHLSAVSEEVRQRVRRSASISKLLACQEFSHCASLTGTEWERLRLTAGARYVIRSKDSVETPLTVVVRRHPSLRRLAQSPELEVYEIIPGARERP